MKKGNLFLGFTLFASAVLMMTACAKTTTAKKTTTENATTTAEVTTTQSQGVNHLSAFVSNVAAGAQTRTYNEKFDEMVNDYSTAASANVQNALRVLVDNQLEAAPVSADASIYKIGTGNYEIETYDGIGFKIRKVGEGTLDLSNLVLALRGGDNYNVYEINLADALNPDGDSLSALTAEYQDYVVSPTLSIEDDSTKYIVSATGEASDLKVLDEILGFHLYCKGECSQVIEISEVYLVKGTDKTVLDSFDRENVGKADASVCWWRGSTGFIVQQGALVNANNSVTADLTATTGANLVLNVMGDTTGTKVGGVNWADLKDANGNAVAAAVNGGYAPLVINLANSGITGRSIEITSTTDLYISEIFASDLNDREAVTVYPTIDSSNVSMFDNFNRTQSGFDGDYDKSSTNEVVTGAGLYYALSYSNGDKVSIADGVVTFDATDLGDGYINFKEGKAAYNGEHYLVLVAKATDGASFDGFRFDCGSGVVWYNDMVSAFGLPLPKANATDYVYTNSDGYMWLIVDLAESGMTPSDYIDFYYSGAGKLMIDCAFYADEVGRYPTYKETEIVTQGPITIAKDYIYAQGFASSEKVVKMVFDTESETLDLSSLRIEGADGAKWFKDAQIIDDMGNAIDATQKLKGLTIYIDLAASGLNVGDWNHVHAGDANSEGTFSYTVYAEHNTADDKYTETEIVTQGPITIAKDYIYAQGFASSENLVKIVFDTESETLDLSSFRIEGADGAKWFKDAQIIDENGNAIDATQKLKGLSIVIDLTASGLNVGDWNHVHAGDANSEGTFSYTVYSLAENGTNYTAIMAALAQ